METETHVVRHVVRRIRSIRKARGLSAAALAEAMREAGVPWDRSIVANIETGRRQDLRLTELVTFCRLFNVTVADLISEDPLTLGTVID